MAQDQIVPPSRAANRISFVFFIFTNIFNPASNIYTKNPEKKRKTANPTFFALKATFFGLKVFLGFVDGCVTGRGRGTGNGRNKGGE